MNDPDPGMPALVDPRGTPIETELGRAARTAVARGEHAAAEMEAAQATLMAKLAARTTSPLAAIGVGTIELPGHPKRLLYTAQKRRRKIADASRRGPKKHARSKAHRGKASGGRQ